MMLSETFVTSISAQSKSSNTAVAKDFGIHVHTLFPLHSVKSQFKKSSTQANSLAVSSTHIFAAQLGKAVVHVYSKHHGNQEALISFSERIHSLTLVHDGLLALGTAEGRVILWEICTGRQVSTPSSHLQAVSCIGATSEHLLTGSEDSNIHVWSVSSLISLANTDSPEPLRRLCNHRAAITSIVMGHALSNSNICVSASKDNTCVVWNYHTGDLLRTFLLPTTPICLTLDPCDRAVYVGFEDGAIQLVEMFEPTYVVNTLYDSNSQATPVQLSSGPLSGAPAEIGAANCLGLSYDGTTLLSGHDSGKVLMWHTGPQKFSKELIDLNFPVTNLIMLSPFPQTMYTEAVTVVKPRLGEGNYTFTGRFTKPLRTTKFEEALHTMGFPSEILESAIMEFSKPASSSNAVENLQKENEDLWTIVTEQRALQKRTYDKYLEAKTGL